MDVEGLVVQLTKEVAALTATVRENNVFLRDFIEAQRHCNKLVEEKIRDIELHGSKPAEEALAQVSALSAKVDALEACSAKENAVQTWWDHTWVRIGIIVGVIVGAVGTIISLLNFFKID